MSSFFAAYFYLLNHPIFPVTVMPMIWLDRFIGFHAGALSLYLSLWFYLFIAFSLLKERRELLLYGAAAFWLSVTGLGVFLVWPTKIPDFGSTWEHEAAFSFLKNIDASGNACPSMHVAFAVFTAIFLARSLREMHATIFYRASNWVWCLAIAYSTLATRQHVALDAVAGALLGFVIASPGYHWLRRGCGWLR